MTVRARIAAAAAASFLAAAAPAAAAPHRHVCGPPAHGMARCHAEVITDADGVTPHVTPAPAGYGPADLASAYNLPSSTAGTGQTIAIVDAYHLPTAQADLDTYRAAYRLPPCGSGCFTQVGQGTAFPATDASWGQEIALDIEMASAICPNCNILLVEANSSSVSDLAASVRKAATLGATVISNSYGAREFSGETTFDSSYHQPGIPVTVSSGDNGYGVEYPASSQYVTAVGGTTLRRVTGGWSESAWSGAGSGCSALEPRLTWQPTGSLCSHRVVADVSAVADPNTGVAVFDSTPYQGASGWMVFGGTSVAAPVIAGVYALAGNGRTAAIDDGSYPYLHPGGLNDVTTGSNGRCGKRAQAALCTAGKGFDGPTGLGTPNGTSSF